MPVGVFICVLSTRRDQLWCISQIEVEMTLLNPHVYMFINMNKLTLNLPKSLKIHNVQELFYL